MTKEEALQMCLEYIETDAHERKYVRHAIKQALALDKMAENARELGLDYEPVATLFGSLPVYDTPPAQRQWVGLTEQERNAIEDYCEMIVGKPVFEAIEAKLRSKNNG